LSETLNFGKMRRKELSLADVLVWPGLVLLGFAVGAYGTMIGAGGGFVLVPLLLLLYPDDPPEMVTSISLAVVFFNAASGTAAYVRQKRVDFLAANTFALATMPGAVLGALATSLFPRQLFDLVFAFLLVAVALLIMARPTAPVVSRTGRRGEVVREITDARGDTYVYSYNLHQGIALSVFVGFLSSLLGIGGGVIHVPIMVLLLHFPTHVATATSHYVLVVTALTGTIVHLVSGQYSSGFGETAALSVGVLVGAQAGARLSHRIHGVLIVRLLALALIGVSLRLFAAALL
jgi:uncharacterized protein